MAGDAKAFMGRGWAYPVGVEKAVGRIKMSAYEEDIAQAIKIILFTRRGERVMRPEFGSNLHSYIFEVESLGVRSRIQQEVVSALELWEPRITDLEVEVEFPAGQTGGFFIHINYVVRTTNNPFNMVYPFYVTEGMP